MSTHQIDDFDILDDDLIESQAEIIPSVNINSKLERRRRIEDLNEERRLQKELNEFY